MRVVLNRAAESRTGRSRAICKVAAAPGQFLGWVKDLKPKEKLAWMRSLLLAKASAWDIAPLPAACYEAKHFHKAEHQLIHIGVHGYYD